MTRALVETLKAHHRAKRADAARNEEHLMAAAEAAFAEHGTGAALEDIARRAGVGIGTLYRHFPTRQALIEALIRQQVLDLRAEAVSLLSAPSPSKALGTWIRSLQSRLTIYRNLPASVAEAWKQPESELWGLCQDMLADLGKLLARAQESGAVRRDFTVDELMKMVWGIAIATDGETGSDRMADKLISVMLDGLRPERAPAG